MDENSLFLGQLEGVHEEVDDLGRKFISYSHCQQLGQPTDLVSDRSLGLIANQGPAKLVDTTFDNDYNS